MNIPKKIELCNKPTRIEKLEKTSKKYNKNIFLKEKMKQEQKLLEIKLES